ncbi:MAG: insulinase family protein [Clostridia bacterium]|nr:insulinase family protein [Clostridia bacterium]
MEQITLSNGFRICLERREYLKSCAVGLYIGSGARFETPQTLGVSHFIEHMLFKGTETLSTRRIAEINDDTGGSLNAYTAKEFTCLYARVLTCHVRQIFSVIADMTLHPALREAELETEKGVILEERSSYEDSPEDLCMDSFYESFWPNDLLGQNIVGTRESIAGMTSDVIRAHMKQYYVPERMVAVFSGAFERSEALALCEEYFGALQNTNNPLRYSVPETAVFVRGLRRDLQQNVLTLGLPGLPLEDPRIHALTYACAILGGAGSSRLFQRIREEMGLVYSIDAFHTAFLGTGCVCISMALSAEHERDALLKTLALCRGFADTVTEDELERAKMQTLSAVTMALESPASSASRIGRNVLLRGKVLPEDALLETLRSVTLDEVRDTAHEFLRPDSFSLCAVGKIKSDKQYRSILRSDSEV